MSNELKKALKIEEILPDESERVFLLENILRNLTWTTEISFKIKYKQLVPKKRVQPCLILIFHIQRGPITQKHFDLLKPIIDKYENYEIKQEPLHFEITIREPIINLPEL